MARVEQQPEKKRLLIKLDELVFVNQTGSRVALVFRGSDTVLNLDFSSETVATKIWQDIESGLKKVTPKGVFYIANLGKGG